MTLGLTLSIRGNAEENVLRAYLIPPDATDGNDRVEVAQLNIRIAERYPDLFETWKELLTEVVRRDMEAVGLTVSHFEEHKPHDSN